MSARPLPHLDADELAVVARRLAVEIGGEYPQGVVLVGLLKGCVYLLADLVRHLEIDCIVDFLALSAYQPGASRIKIMKDLDIEVAGRPVVFVKDVVDSGLSTHYAVELVRDRGAASVRVCCLIDRPQRRILPVEVDFVGYTAGEEFFVGYGIDIAERYRNLAGLYVVKPTEISSNPNPFEADVYGRPGAVHDLSTE